tara:strand:- start:45 stop:308 length:264 start_codon:yes stop_codon:yes gene_type:complete
MNMLVPTVERNARCCKKSMSPIHKVAQIVERLHCKGWFPILAPNYPGLRVVRNYTSACPGLSHRPMEQQSLIPMDLPVAIVLVFHNA